VLRVIGLVLGTVFIASGASTAQALDIRPHEAPAVCEPGKTQVSVTVTGVTPKGILAVELYRPSDKDFLKKASRVHRIRVPAAADRQTVCFDVPSAGTYAVATYHDKNGDRDLAQKWNKMPKEPFGLSTNQKLKFGIPSFYDAAFEVPEGGKAITIALVK